MTLLDATSHYDMRRVRARLPRHVVYRPFPAETVVLNLESGLYHGLNPVAGRMLAVLESAASMADAVAELRTFFPSAADRIEPDLRRLCDELRARGLIVIERTTAGGSA